MTILMLGEQLELGHYRVEFLKSHGIRVIFPENQNAAKSAIQAKEFDAVVLSYTLKNHTATELVELLDQNCPDCPLIAITQKRWNDREFNPDETVLDTDPPNALLDALICVEKRLGQNQQCGSRIRRVKQRPSEPTGDAESQHHDRAT